MANCILNPERLSHRLSSSLSAASAFPVRQNVYLGGHWITQLPASRLFHSYKLIDATKPRTFNAVQLWARIPLARSKLCLSPSGNDAHCKPPSLTPYLSTSHFFARSSLSTSTSWAISPCVHLTGPRVGDSLHGDPTRQGRSIAHGTDSAGRTSPRFPYSLGWTIGGACRIRNHSSYSGIPGHNDKKSSIFMVLGAQAYYGLNVHRLSQTPQVQLHIFLPVLIFRARAGEVDGHTV